MKKIISIILVLSILVTTVPTYGKDLNENLVDMTMSDYSSNEIQFDVTYSGEVSSNNKTDIYKIVLPQSGRIWINMKNSEGGLYYEVCTQNGNKLADLDLDSGIRDYEYGYDLCAGTYYFKVHKRQWYDYGTYEFFVSYIDANETYTYDNNYINDVKEHEAVPFDVNINGQIAINDSCDIYKITLPTSGCVTFNFCINNVNNVYFDLMYGSGSNIDSLLMNRDTRDYKYSYNLTAGTYFIKFSAYNWGYKGGNYTFSASFASANETYTYENNYINDVKSLSAIPFNKKINGQLAINDDCDYYKINVPTSGYVSIEVQNYTNQYLYIYNSLENKIASTYFSSSQRDYSLCYELKAGTYYLKFSKYEFYYNTGNYNFKIKFSLYNSSNIKAVNNRKSTVKITAKKTASVSGYEIRYKTGNQKWKVKTVKGNKNLSCNINKLKKGKVYCFQIRSYLNKGKNKYYSAWSSSNRIRIKK